MKKFSLLALVIFLSCAYLFFACRQKQQTPEQAIAQILVAQVDSFEASCNRLQMAVENSSATNQQRQQLFLQTRLAYKTFEWAAEYFEPATSRAVNGAPVPEVESSGLVFEPSGLQVIEGLLFPAYDTLKKLALIKQLTQLQQNCARYKRHFENVELLNWQVFDAAKLEVYRIETLGITGFDNPLTLKSIQESAINLKSVQKVLNFYTTKEINSTKEKFNNAINYLAINTDFDHFNRMEFITDYCNPLTTCIADFENNLHIPFIRYNRLLNQEAKTFFDSNAFNVNAYSPDENSFVTPDKIALGKRLFADPILSGNGTRSCQSCHQPERAFTDGLAKNTAINTGAVLKRNTPTLLNAALQSAQFYDLRVNTLENQSLNVVQSSIEMHGSMIMAVKKLWRDTTYQHLFSKAFTKANRTDVDTIEVMNAIGSYVRSLVLLNSRFDEYMRGNKAAMNSSERNGFNLFMGKAKCGTCHYMPLFNGTFPPRYVKTEAEVIGVPASLTNKKIDQDVGRYAVVNVKALKYAFKTPTVRNMDRTAPYMHNGLFNTLEQVVEFYNHGGGIGQGIKVNNQTLPSNELNLTEKEQSDIIAFIKSLDSRY